MAGAPGEGWYSDPTGRYSNRYWDGSRWTTSVSRGGSNEVDAGPVPTTPPAPGTGARAQMSLPPQSIVVTNDGGRSSGGTFMGFVFGAIAVIFGFIIVIYAINANDDGTEEDPPTTTEPAADDAPAEDGG